MLPDVTLQEMLVAFKDVMSRAEMFAHHHVQRERLSVRAAHVRHPGRAAAQTRSSISSQLFRPEEGRMGVTVTFIAILELVREGLIEIVQTEAVSRRDPRAAPAPQRADDRCHCSEVAEAEDARLLTAAAPTTPTTDDEPSR